MVKCNMCYEIFVWRNNQDLLNGLCHECSEYFTFIQEPIELSPSDLT
mgnify:FL=1|jgi:hypothetical protein